jgi:transcriptional regulator with XRE-family HTH domain
LALRVLGERLRKLRQKAGLTQQALTAAMGRQGKGSHVVVGRLELGRMTNPGLLQVADYLRACRAGFKDVADVLDAYTALPVVTEEMTQQALVKAREYLPVKVAAAMRDYDSGVKARAEKEHEPAPEPKQRVARAINFGLSQIWAKRVWHQVVVIINKNHLIPGPLNEQILQNFAAKVWRVLNRTRGKRQAKRAEQLGEIRQKMLSYGVLDPEHVRAIEQGVVELFHAAEMAGNLDKAAVLEAGEVPAAGKFRKRPDTRAAREAWNKSRVALVEQLWQEVKDIPELAGKPRNQMGLWRGVVVAVCSIVDHCPPDSDKCRARIRELAEDEYFHKLGRDPETVLALSAAAAPRWEEMRKTLGPHPLGWVRA